MLNVIMSNIVANIMRSSIMTGNIMANIMTNMKATGVKDARSYLLTGHFIKITHHVPV